MTNLRNGIKHPQQISMLIDENEALKRELMEANAQLHGYSAMAATIKRLTKLVTDDYESKEDFISRVKLLLSANPDSRLELHNADVIDKALQDLNTGIPKEYRNILEEYAQQLRDNANKSEGE